MMTPFEEELFEFVNRDKTDQYLFRFKNGDEFIVEYDGEGELELNPSTGEDDDYWGICFRIIKIINNASDKYCEDALIEISRIDYPELIVNISDYSFYRNTYISKCYKCGGDMCSILDYPGVHVKCMNCDEDVASTQFLPIDEDQTVYKLKVYKNPDLTLEQLSILKKLFNITYLGLRKQFSEDSIIFEGCAVEAFYNKLKLDELGIKSSISPNIDYPIEEIMYAVRRRKGK